MSKSDTAGALSSSDQPRPSWMVRSAAPAARCRWGRRRASETGMHASGSAPTSIHDQSLSQKRRVEPVTLQFIQTLAELVARVLELRAAPRGAQAARQRLATPCQARGGGRVGVGVGHHLGGRPVDMVRCGRLPRRGWWGGGAVASLQQWFDARAA
jgi:hypothetical protein